MDTDAKLCGKCKHNILYALGCIKCEAEAARLFYIAYMAEFPPTEFPLPLEDQNESI